jgi:ABC-type nickel/cobalt efflux system permease component RcnA
MKNYFYLFFIFLAIFQINESFASEKASTLGIQDQQYQDGQPAHAHPAKTKKLHSTSHKKPKNKVHSKHHTENKPHPKKKRVATRKPPLFSYPVPVTDTPKPTESSPIIKP